MRHALPGVVFAACAAAALVPAAMAQAPGRDDVSVLAGSCANCHGPDGRSPGAIPSIAGQPHRVLRAQMEAFRANEIPGATVMPRLMRGYTEPEIEALARWFAEIAP